MPYKDPDKQRKFQREWKRARREEFLGSAICARCGSTDNLQLHHRDPEAKEDHRIWSWKRERILEEMAKCEILCQDCHMQHHHSSQAEADPVEMERIRANLQVAFR